MECNYHTHMKGVGQTETDDSHVLIGHCSSELPLAYYLMHHLLGSIINANDNTGLPPNVKEVVLEQWFEHPYSNTARVSKKLLYVSAQFLPADTELLSSYDA
eukprot:2587371-Rhodomonas_salina.1